MSNVSWHISTYDTAEEDLDHIAIQNIFASSGKCRRTSKHSVRSAQYQEEIAQHPALAVCPAPEPCLALLSDQT
ncbi:MAG: hypothetical protein WCL33_09245 [Planctomycetota bacterium]